MCGVNKIIIIKSYSKTYRLVHSVLKLEDRNVVDQLNTVNGCATDAMKRHLGFSD